MTKDRRFWSSLVLCLMAAVPLMMGACLNPVNFSPESIPRIPVDVSGSVDVTIKDVAVFWFINRTKDIDVTDIKIERDRGANETDDQYVYPKNYTGMPKAGSSLASYHNPTDLFYTISTAYEYNTDHAIDVIEPIQVQFPRAGDYKYYLYWDKNGVLRLVDETKMNELPPDPDKNFPDPGPNPAVDSAYTLVVVNVTKDQDVDSVEFTKSSYTYSISNEPRAKDQEMIYLGAGSYDAVAHYSRGGSSYSTTVKNAIVTAEDGSMAVRTNYLYFYKTTAGDYQLSQTYRPIPDDASDENSPQDALSDNEGILRIINKATSNQQNAIIGSLTVNGAEYKAVNPSSPYMIIGAVKEFVLPVGLGYVSFRAMDKEEYGMPVEATIVSRAVTTIEYTGDLGNPFIIPPDDGYGAGVIKITNNSTGVVVSTDIYNKDNLSSVISITYPEFVPPKAVNHGGIAYIPVVGTADVNLALNGLQLIQVALETTEGLVVVERIAALNGQIVSIVINEADLKLGGDDTGGRYGSKVIVENKTTTSTNIAAMYVYNKDNVASSVIYYLDIASPPNSSKSLYILSTVGLPIVDGERYAVKLAVMGNGYSVLIDKEFNEGSDLYSKNPDTHVRTITLNQADLPPELVETFVPVVNVSGLYNELESYYDTNSEGSDPQLKFAASINLNHSVTISPDTASKKSPITWSKSGEGKDYVAINADGVLTVTGIPSNGADKVLTIGVSIADAAGTVGARTTFTDTFSITLKYVKTGVRTQQVTSLSLSNGEVQAGYTLDLKSLVTLSPAGANIDGVLISKEDLVWYINGSVNSGSTYTAPASGTSSVSVYAVLPSGKNNGTQVVSPTTTITITSMAPPFVSVTGVTPVGGGSLSLFYYTKTVGSSGVKTFVQGSQLNLGGSVTVSPSNATNQTITWSAASTLPAGVALNDGVLAVTGIPGSSTATVKATIVGGVSNGNFSANLTVNLVEYHSRLLDSSELLVSNGTVEVGKTLDLVNLVTLPSGLYVNLPGSSLGTITKDDLTWSLSNGNASLAGTSILTGKTAGTLTVTATLPANKNGGTAVSASGTITVKAATPSTFTLRVIKVPHVGDGIYKIAVVPATNTFSESVYQTGYTGLKWADKSAGSYNGTHKNSFPKLSLAVGATYYTVSKFGQAAVNGTLSQVKKDNDWVDLTLPWPSGGITGYMVFFIEADGRVRGYCNPADGLEASGAVDKNFLFYIRPDYLYANRLLPMGTTSSNGHLEVNPSTTSYREVIPVSYTDWENVASIMTSRGAGQRPKLNYTGLDVSKIDYKE